MISGHSIRQFFLDYFAKYNHKIIRSSSVLPPDDTLLFTNAGMNQFKQVFTGEETREYIRATTAQKCIRAGGKHNDLEEVGKTARHHTFFEMLGNFSFGDYFKEQSIVFAWELLLKEFQLSLERLWITVYEDDDEAFKLWKKIGAKPDRILRFGKKDNFWQMGDTGPCGPCSEIHYYMGDKITDNLPIHVNGPGDTTVEIWNLVFMQFNKSPEGILTPLPKPSVDTGAGLERLTSVLQDKKSNYETDLIRPIIDFIANLTKKDYVYNKQEDNISMRVIADHARTTAFCLADGIYPGNTGRNYVLRKIMRRAIWHGRKLGLEDIFLCKICNFVISHMSTPYPELQIQEKIIKQVTTIEEKLFSATLSAGQKRLEGAFSRATNNTISGNDAFDLYQTYGLPLDMISFIADQRKMTVDITSFETELDQERNRARESWKGHTFKQIKPIYSQILSKIGVNTPFIGYETTSKKTQVLAIISQNTIIEKLKTGESGEIILEKTPFYAESGGQVGDIGTLENESVLVRVLDTISPMSGLITHKVKMEQGELKTGDMVTATVSEIQRQRTTINHTATHLLHAALKEILGPHVKQSGSEVVPNKLRFDFTHFTALTDEEILQVEYMVNQQIRLNKKVSKTEMGLENAISSGAVALFGEKYNATVRVVEIPGFSKELCGGTHVTATGDIGLFKIVNDSSIASGIRRIVALTGEEAFARYQQDENLLRNLSENLKLNFIDILPQVEKLQLSLRSSEKEIENLKLKLASLKTIDSLNSVRTINGVQVLVQEIESLDKSILKNLADNLSKKLGSGIIVLGMRDKEKASLLVRVTDDLTKRFSAGTLVKELAIIIEGKGGGRSDVAEAGGKNIKNLENALKATYELIEKESKNISI